jgi:hypothetical protein
MSPENFGIGYKIVIKDNPNEINVKSGSFVKKSLKVSSNYITIELNKDDPVHVINEFVICKKSEEMVQLLKVTGQVKLEEEYGLFYPVMEAFEGDILVSYDLNTKEVVGELPDMTGIVNTDQIESFIISAVENENKYLYVVLNGDYFKLPEKAMNNLFAIIKDHTLEKLEACCKNLGITFLKENIDSDNFELKNSKKLTSTISLPSDVLKFVKEHENLYDPFKLICLKDPNEGLYLLKWYDLWDTKNVITKRDELFFDFVRLLGKIFSKNDKVSLFNLIPYFVKQRVIEYSMDGHYGYGYYRTNEFQIPTPEAGLYLDYLSMAKGDSIDLYPPILSMAHNIAQRNQEIIIDANMCKMFEEKVKDLKKVEYSSKGFVVKAPVTANDLVDEGMMLHHCVATYIPLVSNGETNVVFVRRAVEPDQSFVTVEIDDNLNVLQIKEKFNMDVSDKDVLDFIKEWEKKIKDDKKKGKI